MLDFNLLFVVECDASTSGVRAVLMRSVAYFSKAISDKSMARSTYKMELNGFGSCHSTLEALFNRKEIHSMCEP